MSKSNFISEGFLSSHTQYNTADGAKFNIKTVENNYSIEAYTSPFTDLLITTNYRLRTQTMMYSI